MSDEKKKILLIQACGEKSADMEVTQLALQADEYGLDVEKHLIFHEVYFLLYLYSLSLHFISQYI